MNCTYDGREMTEAARIEEARRCRMEQLYVSVVNDALKRFKVEVIESFQRLQNEGEQLMAFSLTDKLNSSGPGDGAGNYAPLLKAADVKKSITIKVTGIREAPAGWNALAILDGEGPAGRIAVALNKTNAGIVANKVGDKIVGRKVTFEKTRVDFGDAKVGALRISKIA